MSHPNPSYRHPRITDKALAAELRWFETLPEKCLVKMPRTLQARLRRLSIEFIRRSWNSDPGMN
jgi:hypothetical protein